MALPQWEDWFHQLLRTFRKIYLELPAEEKARITSRAAQGQPQTSPVFVSPSQLMAVWIRDEKLDKDLQVLFLTRFVDEPDGAVYLHGPFAPESFMQETLPILENERWSRAWRPGLPFKKLIEEHLVEASRYFGEHFRTHAPGEPRRGEWPGSSWGDFGIYWICFADIRKLDQGRLMADLLGLMQPASKATPHPSRTKAFGIYTHEPLWVGDQPVPTYEQRLQGYELPPDYWGKAWSFPFGDSRLIAWRDGLIAVESEREEIALHLLNGFMGVASLYGLPTVAATGRDLVPMDMVAGTNTATSWATGLYSPTAAMIAQRWSPNLPPVQRRHVLKEEDLRRVVQKASEILRAKVAAEELLFHLYAKTFVLVLEEFTAAFIFGWTIIERHIVNRVQHLPVESARKKKLSRLPVDTLLEILQTSGKLSAPQYNEFMKLKELRNDIIHDAKLVTRSDAEACIRQSEQILKDACGVGVADRVALVPTTWPG